MPHTEKTYRCNQCGTTTKQITNHFGVTYSFGHNNCCPKCPPYKKYPEFGGVTVWECITPPPPNNLNPPELTPPQLVHEVRAFRMFSIN